MTFILWSEFEISEREDSIAASTDYEPKQNIGVALFEILKEASD